MYLSYISFIKYLWLHEIVESEDNLKKADWRLHRSVNLQMFRLSAQYVAASGPLHCLRYGSHFIWSLRLFLCAINFKLPHLLCAPFTPGSSALQHKWMLVSLSASPYQSGISWLRRAGLREAQRIMMLKKQVSFQWLEVCWPEVSSYLTWYKIPPKMCWLVIKPRWKKSQGGTFIIHWSAD